MAGLWEWMESEFSNCRIALLHVGSEDLPAGRQALPTADVPVGVPGNRRQFEMYPHTIIIQLHLLNCCFKHHI